MESCDKPTTNSKFSIKTDDKPTINSLETMIVEYLRTNGSSPAKKIAQHIGKGITQTKTYLKRLKEADLIETAGENKNRTYSIKL